MSQQYQKQKQKWKQQGREEAISEFKEKIKELEKQRDNLIGDNLALQLKIDRLKTAQEMTK
jgi:hypothetical protein